MSKVDVLLGERIKKLRNLAGYSQTELGKTLGVVKQTVSTIEKGQRKLTTEELQKIAKFLGAPLIVILDDNLYKSYEKDKTPSMRNRWSIDVPFIIDDSIDALDQHFDYIVSSGLANPRTAAKQIENIVKLFTLYLKEYKKENNL